MSLPRSGGAPAENRMKNLLFIAVLALSAGSVCAAPAGIADGHGKAGVACEVCHGPDKAKPAEPTIETCTQCHALGALVAKTKDVKPQNPHVSPHYQDKLECTNCHRGHEASEDFCSQCHSFGFKVP